jgi:hypothetical protein
MGRSGSSGDGLFSFRGLFSHASLLLFMTGWSQKTYGTEIGCRDKDDKTSGECSLAWKSL